MQWQSSDIQDATALLMAFDYDEGYIWFRSYHHASFPYTLSLAAVVAGQPLTITLRIEN